ncbi:nuclear transport factor 2 family protein [Nocardia asteroides]|uniref:nuclear transport factor 2 family protein n=1 Tax=Nocardia asteroides TaxID=1824 RepID=UPI001E6075B3|nr:nuclear transport factor 2 family protein [Nocardia asteroides]UGT61846.1 nuclear transport factor 2 family protein [Nocardia asteroides]
MTSNVTAHPSELEITRDLLDAADTDIARFFGYFSEDCTFRMGNNDTIRGSRAIQEWVAAYLGAVTGMRHSILEEWPAGAVTALRVEVTYTLGDGTEFTLPAVTRTRVEDGKVTEYLIFMDPSPVTAAR